MALSGVAPDLDGAGVFVDLITGSTSYYFMFHHYLGHSLFSALVIASLATIFAKTQRAIVWLLAFVVVHIHILCDVIGSKGSDGYHWPIYYLYPLDSEFALTWVYQWELNAWQNQVIIVALMCITLFYAITKRVTFIEVFSKRLDDEGFKIYIKIIRFLSK